MEWVSSLYRVCTISICFNHAHVSSRVVPPYAFGIKPPILSLMITLLFKCSISPLISTSTSYILKMQCPIINFAELRVQKSAPWLRQKKTWRYPRCLVGYCLSQGADFIRFLHLDLGNTEVVPWDRENKYVFLPMSGCRNLHVDLGNILIIIFYHDFSRNRKIGYP